MPRERRLTIGAEILDGVAHFRVWAPKPSSVSVVIESGPACGEYPLTSSDNGYCQGSVPGAAAGDRYRYRIGGDGLVPDPASRFQPDGPHGPSQLVDPAAFRWTDSQWKGLSLKGQVIYELHVGTFTREGTWSAAARELPYLAELGVTVVELMPVAEFPGRFGWGYDGVFLFAPTQLYGSADDFRRFVDIAHAAGLGVILDVVYNHFGPDGCVVARFSPHYFSDRHHNEWGDPLNFDDQDAGPVREFFLENAAFWIRDFHLDGLRLDATQAIMDDSQEHILKLIGRRVRQAAGERATIVIQENEKQDATIIRPIENGGYGLDGCWNDDFHHSAMVAVTGRNEAYYTDHLGKPQEFVSGAKYGYLFQGQRYSWQENRRGTLAFDLEPWQFVNYLQNHDQIPNSGKGVRLHQKTSAGRFRAATALLLLSPGTPFLFQGQEFAASSPFHYFADHKPELARDVCKGRAEFLKQFRRLDHPRLIDELPDPCHLVTFEMCKLDWSERDRHSAVLRLHRDLLALRRTDPAFSQQRKGGVDGAVLGENAFVLRFFSDAGDRLLLVNFGRDLYLDQAPEPLLAPPAGCGWAELWSSENPAYGGEGTAPVETVDGWRIMGEAAIVLAPEERPRKTWNTPAMERRRKRERTAMDEDHGEDAQET